MFHTSAELDVVRQIKETCCSVAFNPSKMEEEASVKHSFRLPDGQVIDLGVEVFRAPEVLFQPELVGFEYRGVHDLLVTSIHRADLDLRKALYSQIVLAGGSTLFPGYGERMLHEVRRHVEAPKDTKIRIAAPPERLLSTWIGGSILASLSTFKTLWVSKKDYFEHGAKLLNKSL